MIYFKVNKIYNLEILVPGVNIKWEQIIIKWNKNKNKKNNGNTWTKHKHGLPEESLSWIFFRAPDECSGSTYK